MTISRRNLMAGALALPALAVPLVVAAEPSSPGEGAIFSAALREQEMLGTAHTMCRKLWLQRYGSHFSPNEDAAIVVHSTF